MTDELQPGIELDRRVAVEVMGFSAGEYPWEYSINFQDASQVLQRIHRYACSVIIHSDEKSCRVSICGPSGKHWNANAKNMPHAICLAALEWANRHGTT